MNRTAGSPEDSLVPVEEVGTNDLLRLVKLALGESDHRSETFWTWKHRKSPFGLSPGLAALCDGEIVALRVFSRWLFKQGDKLIPAVRAVDTATHPEWRRQGLFRRLTEELLKRVENEGVGLVFNTPNPQSRAGYLKMGWKAVGRTPLLVQPRRIVGSVFRLLWPGPRTEMGGGAVEGLSTVSALLEDDSLPRFLSHLWQTEGRFHTPRTLDYLRWRYSEVPNLDYRALWELNGRSGAVIIARSRTRRRLKEVALVEVLVSPDHEGAAAASRLLATLNSASDGDYHLASAVPDSPEYRALRRSGFLPSLNIGPHFTVRVLDSFAEAMDPTSWVSWRLSLGDVELF